MSFIVTCESGSPLLIHPLTGMPAFTSPDSPEVFTREEAEYLVGWATITLGERGFHIQELGAAMRRAG